MANMDEMKRIDERAQSFIQIYFGKNGKPIIRSCTRSVVAPTPKQIKSRIRFGEVARSVRGQKMTGDLPVAAEIVKKELTGVHFPGKSVVKRPEWLKEMEWEIKNRLPVSDPKKLKEDVKRLILLVRPLAVPTPIM